MTRLRKALMAVLLAGLATPALAAPAAIALVHGRILTVANGEIEDGVLVMSGGKITAIGGPATAIPRGATIVNAKGRTIYPGLFDVGVTLGLLDIDSTVTARATTAPRGAPTPGAMTADVVRPTDYIAIERYNGVTNALVNAAGGGPLPGHAATIRLVDDKAGMVIDRDAGLIIDFEGRRKDAYPTTVFGIVGYVRQLLVRARELQAGGAASSPLDAEAAALVPYLDGGRTIIAYANNDTEVGDALDLARDFGLKLVLCGLTGVDTEIPRLAAAKVPVVVGPLVNDPVAGQRFDYIFRLPARLKAAGVPVSIATLGVMPGGSRNLPYLAAIAASYGLSPADVLRAITLTPAQAFGLGDRLGSLEVGKAANVVVAEGDPLDVTTGVIQVYVDGRSMPMTSRQTRLRDRYATVEPRR